MICGHIKRFSNADSQNKRLKVPNVGFCTVEQIGQNNIMKGMNENIHCYFTHSYRLEASESNYIVGKTNHIDKFASVVEDGNIIGTQFHPEKSQQNGLTILKNFLEMN